MKKLSFFIFFVICSQLTYAQYRSDLPTYFDYTGPLIDERAPTVQHSLNRFFSNIEMSHSYSMSFGSFGGNYQNMNAYTNTMQFNISNRMNGRVDISFLHSPFGGNQNFLGSSNMQNQVIIRNAELNYKLSDKKPLYEFNINNFQEVLDITHMDLIDTIDIVIIGCIKFF